MSGLAKTDHFKLITMNDNSILIEKKDGILWMTINRPEKLNALNSAVLDALKYCIADLQADNHIKGAILTGSGEKAFVAGADISGFLKGDRNQGEGFAEIGQAIFSSIENSAKPIIAAVNGFALGGGCELAMSCHFRIASENAKFGQPEINLGIIPGYGGTQRLPRLVGKGKAMELMMTGENIDANEAYRIGLVNQLCKQEDLLSLAESKMKTIISKSSIALAQLIEATNASDANPEKGMITEAACFGKSFASDDMVEGVTAFLEKRKPKFN
jgi:enoyl-CoA hydratase